VSAAGEARRVTPGAAATVIDASPGTTVSQQISGQADEPLRLVEFLVATALLPRGGVAPALSNGLCLSSHLDLMFENVNPRIEADDNGEGGMRNWP
jgi:hypothetical protein